MTPIPDKIKQDEIRNKAELIWSIADKLTGAYKPHEYGLVILPMVVIQRFDCALRPTREAVLDCYRINKELPDEIRDAFLREASKLSYYNICPKGFREVLDNPTNIAGSFRSYINGFSDNVKKILQEFNIEEQIERMERASRGSLLYTVIDEITKPANDLSPDKVSDIDMGYIFEEIIRRFSESYNEDAGQHYTPREVIQLMSEILIRSEDMASEKQIPRSLYDPACGTGGMLSVTRDYINDKNSKIRLQCSGQEYNPETYAICMANTFIKDPTYDTVSEIRQGDTLSDNKFPNQKFNYIISNPPFGREWKVEQNAVIDESRKSDGRFSFGLPAIGDSQMLFLSLAISGMEGIDEGEHIGGRITIIHNGSALFTGDAESGPSEIRRYILENDLLDAIISLPNDIFYNTGIGTYIWVLDNNKEEKRKGKVQLIDANKMYTKRKKPVGNKRVDIDSKSKDIIVKAYRNYNDATYGEGEHICESKIVDVSEFGYIKAAIQAPELDSDGRIKVSKGKTIYDKSKNDTETIPFGKIQLIPDKKYMADPDIRKMVESYLDREVRPYVPFAEIDLKKTKIGFEIPFSRYFYKCAQLRPSNEIKEELSKLIEKLMSDLRELH